jgi:type I restriction enzyme M protein
VVGYEINFNRYFYVFEQPRHPNEIMAEIKELSAEVAQLLGEI